MSIEDDCRQRVVAEAGRWIGTPYRHQGSTRGVGCDCLGLVLGVARALGVTVMPVPAYGDDALAAGDRLLAGARANLTEIPIATAGAGDILCLRWQATMAASHLGIIAGGGRFIHAYQGIGVVSSALVPSWRRRIAAAFQFPQSRG